MKESSPSGIELLWHEWNKIGQQNENNEFINTFPVVDVIFIKWKHFAELQNV